MINLSGSRMEHGNNAAQFTWNNAIAEAKKNTLFKTPEEIENAREYFLDFGAWNLEDLTDEVVQGLGIQEVARAIRTEESEEEGSGKLYGYHDNEWYYYFGE